MKPAILVLLALISFSLTFQGPPPPPPGAIGAYLNGIFPSSTPGGSYELEDAFPGMDIEGPLRILPLFGSSDDLLVLGKIGKIWRISLSQQTSEVVLDITDRSFKLGEAGTVGMVLHPRFGDPTAPDKQVIFVFYRSKPDPNAWTEEGYNRLSKFQWDEQNQRFDANSEEILIQQYDRKTWHNGGGMFFGPDGFLYLSLGDEGGAEYISESTQALDRGLFSGVLRIDVDNDPAKSHPIKRQPLPNANPPAGWWPTFSQGYSIPNDNPWQSPDGSQLEEFYAIGVRSPYVLYFDPENHQIWLTDVGSDKREEINTLGKGDNLQWPYVEGSLASETHQKPDPYIGFEREVFFEYDGEVGSCVIGGAVYAGTKFPELNGKFLMADWVQNKLMALSNTGVGADPELEILLPSITSQPVDLPEKPGITGIYPLPNGEILITVMGEDAFLPGNILRLKRKATVDEPPVKLSDLGVFTDMATLSPAEGLIPYTVNSPLWSDRAIKTRWVALPNDGEFDSAEEQIEFDAFNEWKFPGGTVFIKHFDLPLDLAGDGDTIRLETRFFVMTDDGHGYGLTYKWNEDGTEAFLQGGGSSLDYLITENGAPAYTQTWSFPSRAQCLDCHTTNAKYILGVKTHQLNGEQFYPDLGYAMNQLEYLNQYNVFDRNLSEPAAYPKAYAIDDDEADLETRIRSYLDSNCSSCHRLGGLNDVSMDFRFVLPPKFHNTIGIPTQSRESDPDRLLIEPGDHSRSELWIRDASMSENRMPPLARNLIDQPYIDALAEWIDQLSADDGRFDEILIFPNPTRGWLNVRINDDQTPPFDLTVYTLDGKEVQKETSGALFTQLDLRAYSSGVYLLEINGSGGRIVKKIVLY